MNYEEHKAIVERLFKLTEELGETYIHEAKVKREIAKENDKLFDKRGNARK